MAFQIWLIEKKDSRLLKCTGKESVGRRMVRTLLGRYETDMLENEYGKPYFKDFPEDCFNISDSGPYVVVAVGSSPVGIDLERKRQAKERFILRFFHLEEQKLMQAAADKDRCFTEIWTRKEALSKYLGTGLAHGPEKINTTQKQYADLLYTTWYRTKSGEDVALSVAGEDASMSIIKEGF